MASFNQVMLMGNVTRDPQMKYLPSQTAVCEFGLATNRKYRPQGGGEEREETCFVDCTAFGKQAEVLNLYAQKGKPLFIQGRLKYDTWEDKQGAKRSKLTVIVENFQFIGSRDGGGSFSGAAAESDRRDTSAGREVGREAGAGAANSEHRHDNRNDSRSESKPRGQGPDERQWRGGRRGAKGADKAEDAAEPKLQQADIPF